MVMIRPRAGDFCYEPDEVDVMLRDIDFVKQSEAHGVVLGALRPDATIDQELTGRFVEAARPMRVTFHRAFDWTPDPRVALEQIIRAGCDRVLTSGQAASVELGIALVADLVSQADGRIVVMPGCGVNEHNVSRILRDTGAAEVHFSARRKSVTATTEFEGRVPLSSVDMDARCETCPRLVRAICSAARGGNG
jgi:copper homeostasis protein